MGATIDHCWRGVDLKNTASWWKVSNLGLFVTCSDILRFQDTILSHFAFAMNLFSTFSLFFLFCCCVVVFLVLGFSFFSPPFLWVLLLGWRGWGWGWNREKKIILEEVTFAALWLTTCVSGSLYLHVSHGKEGRGEGVTEREKTGIWFLFVESNSELHCLFPAKGKGKYKFDSSPLRRHLDVSLK